MSSNDRSAVFIATLIGGLSVAIIGGFGVGILVWQIVTFIGTAIALYFFHADYAVSIEVILLYNIGPICGVIAGFIFIIFVSKKFLGWWNLAPMGRRLAKNRSRNQNMR